MEKLTKELVGLKKFKGSIETFDNLYDKLKMRLFTLNI